MRYAVILSVPLLCLAAVPSVLAEKFAEADKICPICQEKFTARVLIISSSRGARLDLKPLGCTAPSPVPVCPKCGFVHFSEKEYLAEDLKLLKQYVMSEDYKKLVKNSETSHYLLSRMFTQMKRDPYQIAFLHLQATWQAEDDKARSKRYLEECLACYDSALKTKAKDDEDVQTGKYLRVELLRRLGKFPESQAALDELKKDKAFTEEPFPKLFEAQRTLIEKKDSAPKDAPLGRDKD